MAKNSDISQTDEKIAKHSSKILQMVLNHFKQLITQYFDQVYKADMQDYVLEANYVVRQLALDEQDPQRKQLSLQKLNAIDKQTALLAQQITFDPNTMTINGVNSTTNTKIFAIAQEIFFYCKKKDDYSKNKIEGWLKQHIDTLLMAARDFLYVHLKQAFISANTEIKNMLAHKQTKTVTKPRPKAISFLTSKPKKKIRTTNHAPRSTPLKPKRKI